MIDETLRGTAADPAVQWMIYRRTGSLCCADLGPYPAKGYQFKDNNGRARCAMRKPCRYHDKPQREELDDAGRGD